MVLCGSVVAGLVLMWEGTHSMCGFEQDYKLLKDLDHSLQFLLVSMLKSMAPSAHRNPSKCGFTDLKTNPLMPLCSTHKQGVKQIKLKNNSAFSCQNCFLVGSFHFLFFANALKKPSKNPPQSEDDFGAFSWPTLSVNRQVTSLCGFEDPRLFQRAFWNFVHLTPIHDIS